MSRQPAAIACTSWRDLPLAGDGRCLVEASAGTGKTWTIAALYLRLLLECGHGARAIVVTTFSIAAAQELRERIRERLRESAAFAATFDPGIAAPADDVVAWLHARWSTQDDGARHDERVRLAFALAELDLAPIGTVHGLCRRILVEHPFDSGSAFDAGEAVASAALDRELREDLWRRLAQADMATLDAGDRAWFADGRGELDAALTKVCRPGVGVRAIAFDPAELAAVMHPEQASGIREWLPKAAFKTIKSVMRRGLESLASFIEAGHPHAPWPDRMEDDLGKPLESQFKPGFLDTARAHPVIVFARRALAMLAGARAHARATALSRYRDDLLAARRQRLHERGQFTFDALVERTLAALSTAQGGDLADRLREAWPVALVDEFQDTDAQQYAILDRIYGDGMGGARGSLVMIGDPKQAIYGFRGGDVHAYLAASASATQRLPLATNFRSSRALVAALNEVFALSGPALGQGESDIAYADVHASGRCDDAPLTVDGEPVARPLAFHAIEDTGHRRGDALASCANAIARLLDERRHRIGPDLVQPGDIAVLLPRNDDVALLRGLLAARRVPCAGAGRSNVFATDTARELQVVLHGIEHAVDEGLVRAALATRLLGGGIDRVRDLLDRPAAWKIELQRFARWRRKWHREGVLAVVQSIVNGWIAGALPPDAERRLTDLRHLGELLQQQSANCDGPEGLLAWLTGERESAGDGDAPDERQLRIESDRRRVQLMTVHASKGLEFAIVFLPLADADKIREDSLPLVRDRHGGRLLDLGSAGFDASVREAMAADQDESFRKLYVALTRARHACHVYVSNAHAGVADPGRPALSALLARMQAGLGGRPVEAGCEHVQWTMQPGWPGEPASYRPDVDATPAARQLIDLPSPRPLEGRHSFSSLVAHAGGAFEDGAASDEADAAPVDAPPVEADAAPHPQLAALAAWRGERFGTALHAMFERRAPGTPMRDQLALVRQSLAENGLATPSGIVAAIAARVQDALEASLLSQAGTPLRLADLAAPSMRAEMRFHYAIDGASLVGLRAACAKHGEPDFVPARASHRLRGMMTGAIDLVLEHEGRFHVLDYKSNWLGDRLSDYAPARLHVEMDRQDYRFQALLYTVALDRYLRQRLRGYRRDLHLGEAIYLFVRAAGLAPDAGVWAHRFDDGLLAAVDAELARAASEEAA